MWRINYYYYCKMLFNIPTGTAARIIHSILRNRNNKYTDLNKTILATTMTTMVATGVIHGAYSLLTRRDNQIIQIKQKYKYVIGGRTVLCVVDMSNRHYKIAVNFWHCKFAIQEHYMSLMEGQTYHATIYGWRIPWLPAFALFPNILFTHPISNTHNAH